MTTTCQLNSETLRLDPLGAAYWPARETLIVSDLHFEKGSAFAARGIMLPPYDTRSTLMRLAALMRRYQPRRVVSLGDAFHDRAAEARMDEADAETLEAMTRAADWLWILGNHDQAPPRRFNGAHAEEARIGALVFRHEPRPGAAPGEIAGHLHPCARVASEGRVLRRRCFAADDARLIMPALGAYTGGLNLLDAAFDAHFGARAAFVLGAEGVYRVPPGNLAPDARARRASRAG